MSTSRVTVYSNGIADVRRVYSVGTDPLEIAIPVRKDHIGDVLASLGIYGESVRLIAPPRFAPANNNSGSLRLEPENVSQELARQLSGAKVKIAERGTSQYLQGTLVGLDNDNYATAGEAVVVPHLVVLTSDGIKRLSLTNVVSLDFTETHIRNEIDKALSRSLQNIKPDSTFVNLQVKSEQNTEAVVHYTVPTPAWKMTYRLRPSNNGYAFEGYAIVDNGSDEDWTDTIVSVVSGEPITFNTDLAQAKNVTRQTVNVVQTHATGNVSLESGFGFASQQNSGSHRAKSLRLAGPPGPNGGGGALGDHGAPGHFGSPGELEGDYACTALACDNSASIGNVEVKEVGDFSIFEATEKVTIRAGESALIPVFSVNIADAKTVLYHQPGSSRPYRSIKFKNETGHSLSRGVLTTYQQGVSVPVFGGSAVLEGTKPGEERLVPHAVETGVRLRQDVDELVQKVVGIRYSDNIAYFESSQEQQTYYNIKNSKNEEFEFVLDHNLLLRSGCKCYLGNEEIVPSESLKNGVRLAFKLLPNQEVVLKVVENALISSSQNLTSNFQYFYDLIVTNECSLADDPNLLSVLELKKKLDQNSAEIAEVNTNISRLLGEQTEIRSNLSADQTSQRWRDDLASVADEIKELTRTTLPALNAQRKTLTEQYYAAIKELKNEWKIRSRKKQK